MKVLVTGSSGVLGHTLVPQLVEKGYDIRLFDMVPTPDSLHQVVQSVGREAKIESITGDMRDKAALREACRDVEVVHHLAVGAGYFRHERSGRRQGNSGATCGLHLEFGGLWNPADPARG